MRSRATAARAALWMAAGALGAAPPAPAPDAFAVPAPGRDVWQRLELPGVERETRYEPVEVDGASAVRSESECSASALAVPLDGLRLERTPVLRWRWKIERGLPPHDERVREGDDFAARVYVMFRLDPELTSWRTRAAHWIQSRLAERELPGQALNYVHSSSEPAGSAWSNPFVATSKMVSLGSGPLPDWDEQRVDVLADYRSLFGVDPSEPLGLAIMTDTDNTCGEAVAYFADFRFEARVTSPPARAYDPGDGNGDGP